MSETPYTTGSSRLAELQTLRPRHAASPVRVALVHDYLTQRGGAERVVLSMLNAFPGAPLYTSLYEPKTTFPAFTGADVRALPVNRVALLRRHHRLGLPVLGAAFSALEIDADLVVCSSSGWAHGARCTGRKVVYCYSPARWLYQPADRYLGRAASPGRLPLAVLRPPLRAWDRRAAATADRYLAVSGKIRGDVRAVYGREAEVLHPPVTMDPDGPRRPVEGVEPGFFLCVSRLLPYKNVGAVVRAFNVLPGERLVVAGGGPLEAALRSEAPANVRVLGRVDDEELRWLYAGCRALVAASYEDFGLTVLEAATFGRPSVVLRWGGFAESVVEGVTGVFFDRPEANDVAAGVRALGGARWREDLIQAHAASFGEERFVARLRQVVAEELGETAPSAIGATR